MRLDGSVAVVTGGASGMGRAMVEGFLREGADVACLDVDEERLARVAARSGAPGELLALRADVTSEEDVREAIGRTREALGEVDVLVNNAALNQRTATGGEARKPVAELPVGLWDAVMDTNVRGPFLCTRAVLPDMLSAGSGRLLYLSSTMARSGRPHYAPYVVSKFAIAGFCDCLRQELDGTGVECLVLRPPDGSVDSETREFLDEEQRRGRHPPAVITEAAVQLAAGRGENGGVYVATPDGNGYERDSRGR